MVQYLSRNAADYLVGEKYDKYHVMQLMNTKGAHTYACVLTVTKVVSVNFADSNSDTATVGDSGKFSDQDDQGSSSGLGSNGSSNFNNRSSAKQLTESEVVAALENIMLLKRPARIIRTYMCIYVYFSLGLFCTPDP